MAQLEQKQALRQTLSPRQIMQAKLLKLNSLSLETYILNEIESNPVLETLEAEPEIQDQDYNKEDNSLDISPIDDDYENSWPKGAQRDILDIPVPDNLDFLEILVKQLDDYSLTDLERLLCEEILWNVDDRGYLDVELSMIADKFDIGVDKILPMLKLVQNLEPKGIGSRNLKECLLVQLSNDTKSLPYLIINNCYDDFINKRYEKIKKFLDCTIEELKPAIGYIGKLNPYPGDGKLTGKEKIVIPDLIIYKRDEEWIIRTNDRGIPDLVVNDIYKDVSVKGKDKKFLNDRIEKANILIDAVNQRRNTLITVMRCIIKKQPSFFEGDIETLRPMKLKDIADEICVDISTVSRSTRGKYVDSPYGIFELKFFFSSTVELSDGEIISNRKAKKHLQELINQEDKGSPLTDEQILYLMKKRGFALARRTIAKYRKQLNIPVSILRRLI